MPNTPNNINPFTSTKNICNDYGSFEGQIFSGENSTTDLKTRNDNKLLQTENTMFMSNIFKLNQESNVCLLQDNNHINRDYYKVYSK